MTTWTPYYHQCQIRCDHVGASPYRFTIIDPTGESHYGFTAMTASRWLEHRGYRAGDTIAAIKLAATTGRHSALI